MRSVNAEYTIEGYLQLIRQAPDDVKLHRRLRGMALERAAAGGRALGLFETLRLGLPRVAPLEAMLASEKQFSYAPSNLEYAATMLRHAEEAGLSATASWLRSVLDAADGAGEEEH